MEFDFEDALVVEAGDLALEFAHLPDAAHAFGFAEGAFGGVVDQDQLGEVGILGQLDLGFEHDVGFAWRGQLRFASSRVICSTFLVT